MKVKISGFVEDVKLKREGVTAEQIFDCHQNSEYKSKSFGSDILAKQIGEKVLIIAVKGDTVIDVLFTKLANKLSYYQENKDIDLYKVAFTATGYKPFYKSEDGKFEAYGKIDKGGMREE